MVKRGMMPLAERIATIDLRRKGSRRVLSPRRPQSAGPAPELDPLPRSLFEPLVGAQSNYRYFWVGVVTLSVGRSSPLEMAPAKATASGTTN